MFINCPHCGALVATDPATDAPPPRCPRCAATLREEPATGADVAAPPAIPPEPAMAAPDPPADPSPGPGTDADAIPLRGAPAALADATGPAPVVAELAAGESATVGSPAAAPPRLDAPDAPDAGAATGAPAARDAAARAAPGAGRPGAPAPSFARTRAAAAAPVPPAHRWLLPTVIAVLALLLAAQWLLADRERLAADPRWRPLVLQACTVLRCNVPAWREPAALSLLDRDVRPHPRQPGVLRVNATFRNDARWPQAWPRVLLTLSDIDGRVVAARHFEPAEYLGAPPSQAALAPGQSAAIRMDVVEPAAGIVAFAFAFD
jgi:hypothetical protein